MKNVKMYSKQVCPYCDRAKALLKGKGISYEEIMVDGKPEIYTKLKEQTGHMTVPQIFIGDKFIGGFSELSALNASGELDQLLQG